MHNAVTTDREAWSQARLAIIFMHEAMTAAYYATSPTMEAFWHKEAINKLKEAVRLLGLQVIPDAPNVHPLIRRD